MRGQPLKSVCERVNVEYRSHHQDKATRLTLCYLCDKKVAKIRKTSGDIELF